MRKSKTPAKVIAAIEFQQNMMRHVDEMLKLVDSSVPQENLALWVRGKSRDYWLGFAEGVNTTLERVLLEYRCYNGFNYQRATPTELQGLDGQVTLYYDYLALEHPEFQEWRRRYHIG